MNTCKYCGCTDARACRGGCYWLDEERTICSACVGRVSFEELVDLATNLEDRPVMRLALSPIAIAQLHGVLQLALRHPQLARQHKFVADFCESLCEILVKGSAGNAVLSEALRRGENPAFDIPVEPDALFHARRM